MFKRILVVVNKAWEAEPIVTALQSTNGRPAKFPESITPPIARVASGDGGSREIPARAAFRNNHSTAEIWCIKDLMDKDRSASSSQEKARVLPMIASAGLKPDLVIAVGTASFPDARSYNGSVIVGSAFFASDPNLVPNEASHWKDDRFDDLQLTPSSNDIADAFAWLSSDGRMQVESRFIGPPINPAAPPILNVSTTNVAISSVNVTNPDDYAWADKKTLAAFTSAGNLGLPSNKTAASVETTHGVIRLSISCEQYVFVSGIANRLGYFSMEVVPRGYAQNFAASHNAGIVVSWLLWRVMNG